MYSSKQRAHHFSSTKRKASNGRNDVVRKTTRNQLPRPFLFQPKFQHFSDLTEELCQLCTEAFLWFFSCGASGKQRNFLYTATTSSFFAAAYFFILIPFLKRLRLQGQRNHKANHQEMEYSIIHHKEKNLLFSPNPASFSREFQIR